MTSKIEKRDITYSLWTAPIGDSQTPIGEIVISLKELEREVSKLSLSQIEDDDEIRAFQAKNDDLIYLKKG